MCINVISQSNGALYPTLYITFVVFYYWTSLLCEKAEPLDKITIDDCTCDAVDLLIDYTVH
jgi:hypothetical protein